MSTDVCPHCGVKLPLSQDAFCGTCGEAMDEPPEVARTPKEQAAFRARVEEEAMRGISWVTRVLRIFGS